jgi:hypothetical protein
MARRLTALLALCVLAGVLGAPANAAPPYRPALANTFSSSHFAVHFDGDPTSALYTTQPQAGILLTYLERAYTTITGLGFSAPPDDLITTPGLLDVYVTDLSTDNVVTAVVPDGGGAPVSGSLDITRSEIGAADESWVTATAVAALFELAHWHPTQPDAWAFLGPAQWLGYKALSYPGAAFTDLAPFDGSIDCGNSSSTQQKCSAVFYEDTGQSHWTFWEFLAQRFGATFAASVWDQQRLGGGSALTALQAALGAQGTTLDDTYHDWSVKNMVGGWGITALDAFNVPTAQSITTGITTGSLGSNTFSVDHLASRYVAFTRGDGLGDHPCFAATLNITVQMPVGINARPFFYWNQSGSTPVALTVSGNTASAAVPWDTCFWPSNKGILSLTNTSTSANAAQFVVTTSLTVDPKTPASPTSAPAAQPVSGTVTPVSDADVPPGITLFGPLLLQVSAKNPQLRLIVESTGEGKVHAQLGSVDLGSPDIRAGNNDLRFTLPKSLLSALRTKAAAGNVLTLTPLSTSGAATGTPVTRDVAVTATPKAKKKKKKH